MIRRPSVPMTIGFLATLLILNGWLYSQAIGHALDHTNHMATTHADPICSWLCASGQVIQGIALVINHDFQCIALLELPSPYSPVFLFPISPISRGPPAFF